MAPILRAEVEDATLVSPMQIVDGEGIFAS
jgi:hypothetical protein